MSDNYDEKYTDPELRREIKDELMESDKGGDQGNGRLANRSYSCRNTKDAAADI